MQDEIDRLRALGYEDLLALRSAPRHRPFVSGTGRRLIGESSVHRDGREHGPLRVRVDVWEPKRLRISRNLVSDGFVRES